MATYVEDGIRTHFGEFCLSLMQNTVYRQDEEITRLEAVNRALREQVLELRNRLEARHGNCHGKSNSSDSVEHA